MRLWITICAVFALSLTAAFWQQTAIGEGGEAIEPLACVPTIVELPLQRSDLPNRLVVQILVSGCEDEVSQVAESDLEALGDLALKKIKAGYHLSILNDPRLRALSIRQMSSKILEEQVFSDIYYVLVHVPASENAAGPPVAEDPKPHQHQ